MTRSAFSPVTDTTTAETPTPRDALSLKYPRSPGGSSGAPTPPPCPPRPLKSSSFSSTSSSASSTSSSSSIRSHSTAPLKDEVTDDEQVYVSSSSIVLVGATCTLEDEALYESLYSTASYTSSSSCCADYSEATFSSGSSYGILEAPNATCRSIFYETVNECQEITCFVEGVDSEYELESEEAIYEVINHLADDLSLEQNSNKNVDGQKSSSMSPLEGSLVEQDFESDLEDDSFDSDDDDLAIGGIDYSQQYVTPKEKSLTLDGTSSGAPSVNRLAEAATTGMRRLRRLRRNWSATKQEVRTAGLSVFKARSQGQPTHSTHLKSSEDLTEASSEKLKLRLRERFRRKSSASSLDSSTFYLALNFASSDASTSPQPENAAPLAFQRSISELPPKSTHSSCSNLVRNASSTAIFRPTNPPPEPPTDTPESDLSSSREALAWRLNQLLSAGPQTPLRRALKSPEGDSSPLKARPSTPPRPLSLEANLRVPESHGDLAILPPPVPLPKRRQKSPSPPPLPARQLSSPSPLRSLLPPPLPPRTEPTPSPPVSRFASEPLYQFYAAAKAEFAALGQPSDSSEDDYEVIAESPRPSASQLVAPSDGRRTLWCELQEVQNSGILDKMSTEERKLQEASFEVITSEASYAKSLEVLASLFKRRLDKEQILCKMDANVLFSDIEGVKKCSEMFLSDLEKRWQESVFVASITDVILKHASTSFGVYVKYCSNQIYQGRKLRHLKETNPRFVEVLNELESSPDCQSLSMQSFLMLPMQRVTRLPLLVDAVFNRLPYGSPQWDECKQALGSLQKIVSECNEAARRMERMEEMLIVAPQINFRHAKSVPLISASRWLVRRGTVTRLKWRSAGGDTASKASAQRTLMGRRIAKQPLYIFLFNDLLIVTKKKSDDHYDVVDWCARNLVQVMALDGATQDLPGGRSLEGHKNLLIMTLLQNQHNKTLEIVLSCLAESDRSRWMEAVTPRTSDDPDERIYEEWDCPQVSAIHNYLAMQPDEFSLEVSDVFNVLKKTSDGWYHCERLRDGIRGWLPGNHTTEVASAHVRARNLRQRHRLLAISSSVVDGMRRVQEEEHSKKKQRRRTIAGIGKD